MWKEIQEYKGLYSINKIGEVLSHSGKKQGTIIISKNKILKQAKDKNGYAMVGLRKNKKRKPFTIHRLVAQAFIPNPENKPQVNHKNGIKTDNRLENLEWCTHSENEKHSYKTLGKKSPMFGKFGKINHLSKQVNQFNSKNTLINTYDSITKASKATGLSIQAISAACRGISKTAGNFYWNFTML